MRNLTAAVCLAVALLMGGTGISWGADFQKGYEAYRSGDYATALREWTPLAEQGYAAAQYNLGLMYRNGWGIPQDDKAAVKWYTLAAEQGLARAQSTLATMEVLADLQDRAFFLDGVRAYEGGDYATALRKWWPLAERGDADVQYKLGGMYKSGHGAVPQDYAQPALISSPSPHE